MIFATTLSAQSCFHSLYHSMEKSWSWSPLSISSTLSHALSAGDNKQGSNDNNSFVLVFLAVLTRGVAAFSQVKDEDEATVSRRPGKKLTEAEEWEARQLRSSGVLDPSEYPTFSDGEVRSI